MKLKHGSVIKGGYSQLIEIVKCLPFREKSSDSNPKEVNGARRYDSEAREIFVNLQKETAIL